MDPREQAAQSMMQAGIGSLGARSTLPRFTSREEAIARGHGGHPDQLWDQKINRIISEGHQKQDRWEELGGPNYNIVAPGKTLNMPQYPVLNKGKLGPGWLEAGIPATNQGYKVMNAASPFDFSADDNWLRQFGQYMKRYLPGYDPEADEYRQKKANPLEGALQGGMTGLLREPNPWLADEYNDKILRDLLEQEKMNKWIEDNNIGPEDLGMEPQLEASAQGLPGTEVAQSKWKEKFQSILDMIMSRENLDERGARKFVFDNYGLAV